MSSTKFKMLLALFFVFALKGYSQQWVYSYDEAKTIASKENRKIVLVFSGSDWCGPCMKLDREVWQQKEFQDYAKDHYVMLRADFPRRKKNELDPAQREQNKKLAETYNKNGYFPLVVVLDHLGNYLGETGYKKTSPNQYIKILETL